MYRLLRWSTDLRAVGCWVVTRLEQEFKLTSQEDEERRFLGTDHAVAEDDSADSALQGLVDSSQIGRRARDRPGSICVDLSQLAGRR